MTDLHASGKMVWKEGGLTQRHFRLIGGKRLTEPLLVDANWSFQASRSAIGYAEIFVGDVFVISEESREMGIINLFRWHHPWLKIKTRQ